MARKKEPAVQDNNTPATQDEYSPMEQAFMDAHQAAKTSNLPLPKFKVSKGKDGKVNVLMTPLNYALLDNMFATTSTEFANTMLTGLCNALKMSGSSDVQAIADTGLSLVAAIKPRDELEAMLAVQMAAIHSAIMTQSRRLAFASSLPQLDSNERALNKLARTFTTQMEALKRYRTGGEQKVTVHHVTVNAGGQAVVGTVEQGKAEGRG